ncbi:MAG: hypothetical protein AAF799_11135 [Myxococcota bacterium]
MKVFDAIAVGLVVAVVSGCGDCRDCQDAIDHLAGRLRTQGCDPSTTQNAVNRIVDDCENAGEDGVDPNLVVGALVEQCQSGVESVLGQTCSAPGTDVRMAVEFVNEAPAGVGEVEFEISFTGGGSGLPQLTGLIQPGATNEVSFVLDHGNAISTLDVVDGTGQFLFSAPTNSKPTMFVKTDPADWSPYRRRRIVFDGASLRYDNFPEL